jgi:hypothetical protein
MSTPFGISNKEKKKPLVCRRRHHHRVFFLSSYDFNFLSASQTHSHTYLRLKKEMGDESDEEQFDPVSSAYSLN